MLRKKALFLGLLFTAAFAQTACTKGLPDCEVDDSGACAPYNGFYPDPTDQDLIMVLASIFAALMAFCIGANDAANSWATSVGSGAIGVIKAVLLCGFFEWAGATTLGYGVSKTIQKGVAKLTDENCWACGTCHSNVSLTMGGSLGALIGASVFLLIASATALPVSTTHAIVGGVVGMTLAGAGSGCLNWEIEGGLGGIALSWVISPVLSGIIASFGYYFCKRFVIKSANPVKRTRQFMPLMYAFSVFCLSMMLQLKAKALKKELTLTWKFIISGIASGVAAILAAVFERQFGNLNDLPSILGTADLYLRANKSASTEMTQVTTAGKKQKEPTTAGSPSKITVRGAEADDNTNTGSVETDETSVAANLDDKSNDSEVLHPVPDAETPGQVDAIWMFRSILVFNACVESFAHGSNDTANATGPFSAVYQFWEDGRSGCDSDKGSIWILSVAGLFVAIGVFTFGYRVIRTIGTNLTVIDFHKGFWIEFGSTMATMTATVLEFPVSTTHCQVGAVVGIGLITQAQGVGTVAWGLFGKIAFTWVMTLPISGSVSALIVLAIKGMMTSIDSCPAVESNPFSP